MPMPEDPISPIGPVIAAPLMAATLGILGEVGTKLNPVSSHFMDLFQCFILRI